MAGVEMAMEMAGSQAMGSCLLAPLDLCGSCFELCVAHVDVLGAA